MKKCLPYILAAVLVCAAAFTTCKKEEKPKTVKVAAQSGALTSGEAGTVTFDVTTENITDGKYTATVDQLPAGVTVQEKVTIRNNSGTLTLAGSETSTAGVYNNLRLTIDGEKSKKFTLTVTAATYTINASPATLPFGSLESSYTQPAAKTVTVTNTGTGTVTLNALPAVANYTLAALSKTTLAAGETATFTARPNENLAAGTYNTTINITGSGGASATVNATFEVKTCIIDASPATLLFGSLETGYTQPVAKIVIVTNIGTGTVTLNALPAVSNYTLTDLSKTMLVTGETATFTVRPNENLAAGTYNPTINITGSGGASATVNASFEVTITLTQPTAENYEIGALLKTTLTAGETATFTVRPNAGLAAKWKGAPTSMPVLRGFKEPQSHSVTP